ncbi:MAG TPA: MATE family efflux transporter [Ottowia sp.]|nr:MAG: MATE family efflux transporter [Burkholderiales bacterium 68-10]HMT64637.1 MATE family efflux transporter [Ottowia sp.]HMT83474.1 MATE family efflux transporter [Ottowia sp.]HOK11364.1 MATE family efflux transporter [Ottowia sp.]HPP97093.1 MATE family efflux transporter [Ottowia sp.]
MSSRFTPAGAARPLWRVYLAFVGPMVLANILQSLSGSLNGVYIGQMLGTQALAAVAGMFPVVFFFVALIIGLGAGASVLIGQAWGAREPHKVKAIAGTALALCAGIGVVGAALGEWAAHGALAALGTPAAVLDEAVGYARVMLLGMPLLLVFILSTQLLRGVGDTVTPLKALLLSTGVGLVLTPMLIRGWLGLPPMGVASAAVANIVSSAVALAYLAWHLRRASHQGLPVHPLAPDAELARALRPRAALARTVLRIGVPTGVQMITIALAELVILRLVNDHGPDAAAAYGAVNQIVNYVQFPALSIAITASILGAQAIGAGKAERLAAIVRTGLAMTLLMTGALVLLGYALSDWLLGFFLTNAPVRAMAAGLLHLMLWGTVVFGMQAVLGGVMRASGTVWAPVSIAIACILLVQLPTAHVLDRRYGLAGVWLSYPVVFCAMLLCQGAFYWWVWRHRRIERLV